MPICVSDYTWHQTPERVTVMLDLHHTSPKKVDVVTTCSYLKVSFLPYIFEVFLCHLIKVDLSSARILQGHLELSLMKADPQPWKELGLELTREEMELRRQEAIKDMEEGEKNKARQRKEECSRREKFAISQQILVDDQVREERSKAVEQEKAEFFIVTPGDTSQDQHHQPEKPHTQADGGHQHPVNCRPQDSVTQQADDCNTQEKETHKASHDQVLRRRESSTCSEEGVAVTQEADYDGDGEDSIYYSSTENLHLGNNRTKNDRPEAANRRQRKSNANRKAAAKEKEGRRRSPPPTPPVRPSTNISITHTPRVFPSPSRESTHNQEQKWLAAQSATSSGPEDESTSSFSQHSEEHFKKKAVTLFSSGDYQGCVNACTEGLRLNPSSPAFYSNRAAAHLALRNLHHTVKDSSKALELLTPPTPENGNSRLLCHIRRGTALVRLSLLTEGLADYQAALQLSPENKALRKDADRIQSLLLASTDSNEDSGCEEEAEEERGMTSPRGN